MLKDGRSGDDNPDRVTPATTAVFALIMHNHPPATPSTAEAQVFDQMLALNLRSG